MISISKERLDRAFFRYDSNRFTDKLMGVIKFSFIPLCIIEGIAAVLLTYKSCNYVKNNKATKQQ